MSLEQKYWARVDRREPDECWPWIGHVSQQGYGIISRDGRPRLAHRVGYELVHGGITADPIDHVCHNGSGCAGGPACPHRRCQNPSHLEQVSLLENKRRGQSANSINRRKTHCKRGHEFTPENTRLRPLGRSCRTCDRAAAARSNEAARQRRLQERT